MTSLSQIVNYTNKLFFSLIEVDVENLCEWDHEINSQVHICQHVKLRILNRYM